MGSRRPPVACPRPRPTVRAAWRPPPPRTRRGDDAVPAARVSRTASLCALEAREAGGELREPVRFVERSRAAVVAVRVDPGLPSTTPTCPAQPVDEQRAPD